MIINDIIKALLKDINRILREGEAMFTIAIHPPLFCVAFLVVFIITFLVRIIKRGHRIRLCYIGIIELYIMLLISVTIFPIRIIPSEMRTGKNSILDSFRGKTLFLPFYTLSWDSYRTSLKIAFYFWMCEIIAGCNQF